MKSNRWTKLTEDVDSFIMQTKKHPVNQTDFKKILKIYMILFLMEKLIYEIYELYAGIKTKIKVVLEGV